MARGSVGGNPNINSGSVGRHPNINYGGTGTRIATPEQIIASATTPEQIAARKSAMDYINTTEVNPRMQPAGVGVLGSLAPVLGNPIVNTMNIVGAGVFAGMALSKGSEMLADVATGGGWTKAKTNFMETGKYNLSLAELEKQRQEQQAQKEAEEAQNNPKPEPENENNPPPDGENKPNPEDEKEDEKEGLVNVLADNGKKSVKSINDLVDAMNKNVKSMNDINKQFAKAINDGNKLNEGYYNAIIDVSFHNAEQTTKAIVSAGFMLGDIAESLRYLIQNTYTGDSINSLKPYILAGKSELDTTPIVEQLEKNNNIFKPAYIPSGEFWARADKATLEFDKMRGFTNFYSSPPSNSHLIGEVTMIDNMVSNGTRATKIIADVEAYRKNALDSRVYALTMYAGEDISLVSEQIKEGQREYYDKTNPQSPLHPENKPDGGLSDVKKHIPLPDGEVLHMSPKEIEEQKQAIEFALAKRQLEPRTFKDSDGDVLKHASPVEIKEELEAQRLKNYDDRNTETIDEDDFHLPLDLNPLLGFIGRSDVFDESKNLDTNEFLANLKAKYPFMR